MKRCETLCLFEPPQAWAISNTYIQQKEILEVFPDDEESAPQLEDYPNARVATGVSLMMYDDSDNRFNALGDSFAKLFGCFSNKKVDPTTMRHRNNNSLINSFYGC